MEKRTVAAIVGIVAVIVAVFIIAGLMIAAGLNERNANEGYIPLPRAPLFVGKPVLVIGQSSSTQGIVDRLSRSTDNVTVVAGLDDMPDYRFTGMIMIDGNWGSHQDLNAMALVLAPYVVNGTALAMINMTTEIVGAIGNCSGHVFSGASLVDGRPTVLNGFWYGPSPSLTSWISLGGGSDSAYWNGITDLYEWGTLRNLS